VYRVRGRGGEGGVVHGVEGGGGGGGAGEVVCVGGEGVRLLDNIESRVYDTGPIYLWRQTNESEE